MFRMVKVPWCPDEGASYSNTGVTPRAHREGGRCYEAEMGTKAKAGKQAKADLKPPPANSREGRVSVVRWNPKGIARSSEEPEMKKYRP